MKRTFSIACIGLLALNGACTRLGESSLPGIKPDYHPAFPIAAGSVHAFGDPVLGGTLDCDSCHPPTAASFKEFTCVGCHEHGQVVTGQLHAAVADYAYTSDRCLDCHPVAEHLAFSHTGVTNGCASCHDVDAPFAALPEAGFTHPDMGGSDCSSCHSVGASWVGEGQVPAFIVVGGFTIPAPPASTPTVQSGIANLPHPESTGACTTCHASSVGAKQAKGYDHASAGGRAQCSPCHEAGSNLVETVWNGATTVAAGAGDTRPFTLTSVVANEGSNTLTVSYPNHFYPADCFECHVIPGGVGATQTGTAYRSAWRFPHTENNMSEPSTCVMCHTNGIPD